jgi:hypothetical protein
LLQRLCNARKGTLIWGEHKGVLSQFARIYTEVASFSAKGGDQREKFFASNESPNFWIAIMCSELPYVQNAIVRSARMLLNSLYAQYRESHDIVGFKEVRYGMDEAALLRWCYPEARMFLLVRHPCDAWNSTPRDWYSLEEFIEKWNKHTRDFLVLSRTDPNCRLIRYEDIVRQDARTMQIIRETARVTDEQMKPVLAKKLGSKHHGVSDADREAITEGCREIMELFDYR